MTVEFEISFNGDIGVLEGKARPDASETQFIQSSFSKVGTTMNLQCGPVKILRIIRFTF